ncbi:hypothetical protein, conserved [Eimeria maxima]|uniref:Uncharacterized protein n=1 Tax=Eimeria maxima TaxID=5804 RepID=U6M9K9_EIMMA|nr:hypothetical protein, conserved [Eimeria maxima]CDJ60706.1 hypothetical protein, conserved [Eimeria maxima]
MALLGVLPRAPRCSGVWSLWVLFSLSGLLLGSLLLLGGAAAAAEPAASGSHAREAFESEQDGDELTISSGGTPGVEPLSSPAGPPQRGGGMRTGFVYYDDDSVDEEEGSETDEDVDDLVGAELQAEQEKAAEDAAGGEQGRPQLSMQVVLWCILSAAVYLIMRGASREDEKQKSLEVHKVLLGNTVKKLEADRAAAAALETHIQALTEEKITREEQVAAAEKKLQTLVRDLQAAAAAGEEGLQQQQEKEAEAAAATIGLPTLENTCREASRELQLLLLHLGDASYTEEVARRSLQQLLADRQQLVQEEKRDSPSGQRIPKEGDFLGALSWLEATATEWNVYGSRGDTKGGRERPAAASGEGGEEARLRGRVVSLLGAAGLMLQRWQQLEGEAVAARAALQQQEEKVHQQVAESKQRAAALLQELRDCSNWAKLWSERVRSSLGDGTTAGERFAAVTERVATTLQHVEFVFSHRGCTLQHQKASGSPKSAVAVAAATAAPAVVAAAATAEGSVPEGPGEVAEEVLVQLHSACGDVVEEAAAFKTAASESEEKQKIVEKEKQDLLDRAMSIIVKIGAFREQQIAAEAEQHISSITAAGLLEKHKLLQAPLDQTREWFANLQQTLNNISSSNSLRSA